MKHKFLSANERKRSNYVALCRLYSIICLTVVKLSAAAIGVFMFLSDNEKMNNILNIAFELFLENGYEATSIRQICKKVGLEPPTLYYFFGSKKLMFLSMLNRLCGFYLEAIDDDLSRFKNAEEKLFHIYCQNIEYTMNNPQTARFFLRFTLFPPEGLKEEITKVLDGFYEKKRSLCSQLIEECVNTGVIDVELSQASQLCWKFINNSAIDVVLWDWRPDDNEIKELWRMFVKCRLRRLPAEF